MNILLAQANLMPVIYGIIVIVGIAVVIVHLAFGKLGAVALDIGLFVLVFWMHGGSLTGGMSAAVAALIGGIFLPPLIKLCIWIREKK